MNKKPVTKLDLNQRYMAIVMYESQPERLKKHKIADIANFYNCSETQIYELIKIKEEFKKKYEEVLAREGKVEGFNLPVDYSAQETDLLFKKVHEWYLQNVTNEFQVISGPVLRKKAVEFAKQLKMNDFVASYSWVRGFSKRYKIRFRTLKEKTLSTDFTEEELEQNMNMTDTAYPVPMAISRAKPQPQTSHSAIEEPSGSDIVLHDYQEAMTYLKKLEDFALLKEDFRLIGLIERLMELFKANDEHGEPELENVPLEIDDDEDDEIEEILIDSD